MAQLRRLAIAITAAAFSALLLAGALTIAADTVAGNPMPDVVAGNPMPDVVTGNPMPDVA